MKTNFRRNALAAFVAAVLTCTASALTIGDANYVGSINDGIPSNPANEVVYINTLTGLAAGTGNTLIGTETYNRVNGIAGPFSAALELGSVKDDSGGNTINATGFAYVLGKYDASQAGSLVWYFAGGAGNVTLPTTYNGFGLSHISLYRSITFPGPTVPDGGSTLALLGLGLGLLALARRKLG